jgi:hypothetical protein
MRTMILVGDGAWLLAQRLLKRGFLKVIDVDGVMYYPIASLAPKFQDTVRVALPDGEMPNADIFQAALNEASVGVAKDDPAIYGSPTWLRLSPAAKPTPPEGEETY